MTASAIFSGAGLRRGFLGHLAMSALLNLPVAIGFGMVAREAGMSLTQALVMNGAVFAGPAQLLVIDMLNGPTSLVAIAVATLVVNARFAVMSAAIYQWYRALPTLGRYLAVMNLSAAVFGASMALYRKGERDTGTAIGAGAAMWVMSAVGVVIGVVLGARIPDPHAYGVDCIGPAFFAVLAGMFFNGRKTIAPWLGAIAATLAAMAWLPAGMHIFAGAIAGGLIGALQNDA